MTPGVVVVAYGSPDLLCEALAPLGDLPVVVVDNSSSEAVRAVCADAGAAYVDPGKNLGFAGGVNVGVRELWATAGRRDVLLLNPDAVLPADDVLLLHDALRSQPRTAAVAPRLVGPEGAQRVAWPWPAPGRMWREALLLLGSDRDRGDWLVGAVLLISADALDEVGPFDERFFLYAEETDWQRRAVDAGWTVHAVDTVVARHVGAATSTDLRRRETLFHAAGEIYIRKWYGAGGWALYRAAALLGAVLRSVQPGERGARARRSAYLFARGPRRVAAREAA